MAEEEGIAVAADATLAHCKKLLHDHFAAVAPQQARFAHEADELRGRTFAHTFMNTDGEWTDAQYRWARGLAPTTRDECSRLPLESLPPEVKWGTRHDDDDAGKRWCFYNVRLPYPELSWIGSIQMAGEELDQAVRLAVGDELGCLLGGAPLSSECSV